MNTIPGTVFELADYKPFCLHWCLYDVIFLEVPLAAKYEALFIS